MCGLAARLEFYGGTHQSVFIRSGCFARQSGYYHHPNRCAKCTGGVVRLDAAMAESYIAALRELCQQFDLVDDISVMRVAENRELFVVQKADDNLEQLWTDVQQVLSQATTQFLAQREAEGERLKNDIAQKKEAIARIVPQIEELSEKSKAEYHDKLKARLEQALSDQRITIDENRILTECALFADRVCGG